MTPERVLRAAINSMINGHHKPHCFSAWIKGQGYVKDGSPQYDRADYLRQLERTATSEVNNMDYASKYIEPGYDQPTKGIFFANWNYFPTRVDTILEKMGFAVEWSDEWSTCENCNGAFRTSPDSFCWKPSYSQKDPSLCLKCYEEEHQHDNEEEESEEEETASM